MEFICFCKTDIYFISIACIPTYDVRQGLLGWRKGGRDGNGSRLIKQ